MRSIFRGGQIFGKLMGHVLADCVAMKDFYGWWVGKLPKLLDPRFFDKQLGWLQQQDVSALSDQLS